jgi:hypothetical protein
MPHKQASLTGFASKTPVTKASGSSIQDDSSHTTTRQARPKLGFENTNAAPAATPSGPHEAVNLDYILWTGRYPYAFDAARLGYGIGHREDCSFCWTPESVSLNTQFLDNYFQNPNLDRFVDNIFDYEPDIAVLGDIEDERTLDAHLTAAEEVWGSYPDIQLILVPKCRPALENIPEAFILGYPNGKSDIKAGDVAPPEAWRGRDIHILGGTPLQTWTEIEQLTRPSITDTDPANIVGIDSNVSLERALNHGIYRKVDGGEARHLRDEYMNKRALILYSLINIKHFWAERGVWPSVDAPGRDQLPDRSTLLEALGATCTSQEPTHHLGRTHPSTINNLTKDPLPPIIRDVQTLSMSPRLHEPPTETPSIRTDETQAAVKEPLLPVPYNTHSTFHSAGELNSAGAVFDSTHNFNLRMVCHTCGGDLHAPSTCRGADVSPHASETEPACTAKIVSYDHEHTERTNHYTSVVKEAPENCADTTPGKIVTFCSEQCRKHAEARLDTISPADKPYPSADVLQKIKIFPELPHGEPR